MSLVQDSFTFYPSSYPRMSTLTHHNSVQCHYHSIFQFHPSTLDIMNGIQHSYIFGGHVSSIMMSHYPLKTKLCFSFHKTLSCYFIIQIHPTPYPPLTYHVHALLTSPTCLQTYYISCKLNTQIRIIFNILNI